MKADYFAFGVALFIAVVGDLPFSKATADNLKYRHIFYERFSYFWKLQGNINVSDEFKDLIQHLLWPNPAERLSCSAGVRNHPWFCGEVA